MKNLETLKINNQVCFSLYTASRLMTQLYHPILDEFDLTYPQYLVMLVLWENKKLSVKEIGKILYLDSGTLTPLLKNLETKGFVTRKREKKDERVVSIEITDKSTQLLEKASDIPNRVMCNANLNIEDIIELKQKLDKLINENLKKS